RFTFPDGSPSASIWNDLALGDRHLEIADAVDMALELVALLGGPDARGRAGEDQVAGFELEQTGQELDLVGDVPDHLRQVARLLAHAIDLEPDRTFVGALDVLRGNQGSARR